MLANGQEQEFMSRVDEAKRTSVRHMLAETAFVMPVVASFAMSDLKIDETQTRVYSSNV